MRLAPLYILAALLMLACTGAERQKMVQRIGEWTYQADGKETRGPYLAFEPAGWNGSDPPPLLIFLHGAGYRGQDVSKLENAELVKQIRAGREFPAIVMCPQVSTYWNGEQAAVFIDQALELYAGRHDPDRIHLTGESAGGGGAWEGAKRRAEKLAAVVPIATTIGLADDADRLTRLPIWAFHNVHDPYQSVEKSRAQVKAIRDAGGKHVFLTEYTQTPGKPHKRSDNVTIWPNAHRHAWETAYRDEGMWQWLFRQRRGQLDPAIVSTAPAASQPINPPLKE